MVTWEMGFSRQGLMILWLELCYSTYLSPRIVGLGGGLRCWDLIAGKILVPSRHCTPSLLSNILIIPGLGCGVATAGCDRLGYSSAHTHTEGSLRDMEQGLLDPSGKVLTLR